MKNFKTLGLLAIGAGIILATSGVFETTTYADSNTDYKNSTMNISDYNYRNNNMMNDEFNNNCSSNRSNSSCSNNMSEYEDSNSSTSTFNFKSL